MLEFLCDYLIYFWNLLFRRNIPPSGALTSTEAKKKTDEETPEKQPVQKPEPITAETALKEQKTKDPSPIKTVKPQPLIPIKPQKKIEPDSPTVQTNLIQYQKSTSRQLPAAEPDEHVLNLDYKFDKLNADKKDSFIEFERSQQSKVKEVQTVTPATKELGKEDIYEIEDEEIESIVEDILNYEKDLPNEGNENSVDDDLQEKIRERIKTLQEQDNHFQYQTPSQILKSTESISSKAKQTTPSTQLKYTSEEFEDNIGDEEE